MEVWACSDDSFVITGPDGAVLRSWAGDLRAGSGPGVTIDVDRHRVGDPANSITMTGLGAADVVEWLRSAGERQLVPSRTAWAPGAMECLTLIRVTTLRDGVLVQFSEWAKVLHVREVIEHVLDERGLVADSDREFIIMAMADGPDAAFAAAVDAAVQAGCVGCTPAPASHDPRAGPTSWVGFPPIESPGDA